MRLWWPHWTMDRSSFPAVQMYFRAVFRCASGMIFALLFWPCYLGPICTFINRLGSLFLDVGGISDWLFPLVNSHYVADGKNKVVSSSSATRIAFSVLIFVI